MRDRLTRGMLAVLLGCLSAGPASAVDGAALFDAGCAACHGGAGAGTPGLAPPLAGNPILGKLAADAPAYVAGVMIGGLSGRIAVAGETFVGAMPPQAHYADAELLALLTYVLQDLNDLAAPPVDAIAAARAAALSHGALIALRSAADAR